MEQVYVFTTLVKAIPHFEHSPGLVLVTSGCIGQAYFACTGFAFAGAFLLVVVVVVVVFLPVVVWAKLKIDANDAITRTMRIFI